MFPLNVHVHILHTYMHNIKFVLLTLYIASSDNRLWAANKAIGSICV